MNDDRLTMLEPDQLPSLPGAAVRLLELSRCPDATIQEICDTIRSDPAIAARVIKAANSPYFGLRREVTSIDRAACLLGPGVLTTITLTFCLANDSVSDRCLTAHYQAYWLRVVVQAVAADTILRFVETKEQNAAFLSGLLCDIGHLAMLKVAPQRYTSIAERAPGLNNSRLPLESEQFGMDHTQLGVVLGKKWQLPQAILEAIQHHHVTHKEVANLAEISDVPTMKATVVASATADHLCGNGDINSWQYLQDCCQFLFALNQDQVAEFLQRVHTGVNELSTLFDIDTGSLPDPALLTSQARDLLIEYSMQIQMANREAVSAQHELQMANDLLARQNEALQDQVIKDQLTDVYTRSFFDECLQNEMTKCSRSKLPIAVAFCDIDHFKSINDKYGHQFGDEVLRGVARVLEANVRRNDVLARYGGEEFVVMLPGLDPEHIETVIERMRRAVEERHFEFEGHPLRVSISIGACTLVPGDQPIVDASERLVIEADKAMYRAKHNGRNQTRTQVMHLTSAGDAGNSGNALSPVPVVEPYVAH